MGLRICASCKHENACKNHFCTQCGARLSGGKDCPSKLLVLEGEPKGAIFLIGSGSNTIGRESSNSIVLSDEQVSAKHAAITLKEDGFWIEDLESKNGVFVNGQRISKRKRLYDGRLIKLGSSILSVEINGNGLNSHKKSQKRI